MHISLVPPSLRHNISQNLGPRCVVSSIFSWQSKIGAGLHIVWLNRAATSQCLSSLWSRRWDNSACSSFLCLHKASVAGYPQKIGPGCPCSSICCHSFLQLVAWRDQKYSKGQKERAEFILVAWETWKHHNACVWGVRRCGKLVHQLSMNSYEVT